MHLDLADLVPGRTVLDGLEVQGRVRSTGLSSSWRVASTHGRESLTLYPASLFDGRERAEGFARTLEPLVSVRHTGLHAIHSVQVLDDGAVVVLAADLVGRSLRGWLSEGEQASPAQARTLGISLLAAIAELHEAGLAHGDVKPEHVWLDGDWDQALLTDASVTPALWTTQHLGARTQLIGTPFYAPLEQFSGDMPGPESDLYNLATTLFEVLTGRLPWRGSSFVEVFQEKMQPVAVAPSSEPDQAALLEVLTKALQPRRTDRFPSAAALLAALESCSVGGAV